MSWNLEACLVTRTDDEACSFLVWGLCPQAPARGFTSPHLGSGDREAAIPSRESAGIDPRAYPVAGEYLHRSMRVVTRMQS